MNLESIGKFIATLRKEQGLTQEELSIKLETSREAVSKWERGVNLPNPECLIMLSNLFKVSVNEILLGERENSKNKKELEQVPLNILEESRRKFKKSLGIFVIEILVFLVIVLTWYFFNTYRTIYIYRINGASDNFKVTEGLAIFSKNKSYLKLGEIIELKEEDYISYELFYYDKEGSEKLIYKENDDDYTLISISKYDNFLPYKERDQLSKNMYLRIISASKEEVMKLDFQEDLVNSF